MSSEKKDTGFSFENTPNKIGGDPKSSEEFTFTDIPVMGKQEKEKKSVFSFDRKKQEQPKSVNRPEPSREQAGETRTDQAQGQPQEKWDNIAVKKKFSFKLNLSRKNMILVLILAAAVVGGGASAFLLLKPGKKAADAQAGGTAPVKSGKKDPKAEEEAKRQAELEKKLASAVAAQKESKFAEALKIYQSLLTEGWKEKQQVLFFGEAECHENLKHDDDALKGYQKCMEGGWKENPQPFLRTSKILAAKGKNEDALKVLEKAREIFPADIPLGTQLALAYNNAGQIDKSAAEFKKIGKSDLSLENLRIYCSILQKKQDKEQARELYVYASKRYRDLDCFMSAAMLMDKPQDKIDILNQALGAIDEKKKSVAIMYLTEILMQSGKKDEAAKQLDKINLGELKPEKIPDFLKMLVSSGNLAKFKTEYKQAIDLFPNDFALHQTICDALMEGGQDKLAMEMYSDWWINKSQDYIGGYFYAKAIGVMPDEVVPIYKKITELNPAFFEGFYELAYFYTLKRDFQNAEYSYAECARLKPNDRNVQQLCAFAKARNGKGEEAIESYGKFLSEQKLSPEDRAVELLNIAFRLPSSDKAEKLLEELKVNPKYADEYKTQLIRYKMAYGKPEDEDFAEQYPKAARKYHEIYLLSKGRNNEVLLMTVPPDEFPDFWKLFILWRTDKPGWQDGIDVFMAKNKAKKDAIYGIVAAMWNGKLSPDDARKNLEKIHPDNEALFYLLLAEKYRKDKVAVKAKVSYQRAASEKQNPISRIADFMTKQPMK